MPTHITAARDALLTYIHSTGKTDFSQGNKFFSKGIQLWKKRRNRAGATFRNRCPLCALVSSKESNAELETNCIDDWEEKVDAIVEETLRKMTLISGIPSWVQMYFEKIKNNTGKSVGEAFPRSLFCLWGVNFEPYRSVFKNLIGRPVDTIELFPASEGFAYQDQQEEEGLLLLLNNGIFYEFIPVGVKFGEESPRYSLAEIELSVNYVLILSTTAGLWSYNIGDTVRFVPKRPTVWS